MRSDLIIGVDFDNTVVNYDKVLYKTAVEWGLISSEIIRNKKNVRNYVRQLPNGEIKWRELQAFVYGKGMVVATLFEGVMDFFHACKNAGISFYVVSHKTKYSTLVKNGVNLREMALTWMERNSFFDKDVGLSKDRVFFESTQEEKINRVKQLGCTHFIDDLEEVFLHELFPNYIENILFVSSRKYSPSSHWKTFASWREINEYFFESKHQQLVSEEIKIVENLLDQTMVFSDKIGGGANSRVYRIKSECAKQYVAKFYFQNVADTRDRLETEFSGLSFLWEQGLRCISQPIAVDKQARCAVYQYIDGRKILPSEVTVQDIDQVVQLLGKLKTVARKNKSKDFLPASEACFSIRKIVENIEWRLERLQRVSSEKILTKFLNEEFEPFLIILVSWSKKKSIASSISFDSDINLEERTLSPSDFGYHNALKNEDGHIVFIDFEYFGWDDPTKMIADFLLHPAMEFDEDLKIFFIDGIFQVFKEQKYLFDRFEIVFPLFGLKWCLIFLNEFIPDDLKRRHFAEGPWSDKIYLQKKQLTKARKMLDFVKSIYQECPYKYEIR